MTARTQKDPAGILLTQLSPLFHARVDYFSGSPMVPSQEGVTEMDIDNRRIITAKEVSTYLQMHTSTVYRVLKHGRLPAFTIDQQ